METMKYLCCLGLLILSLNAPLPAAGAEPGYMDSAKAAIRATINDLGLNDQFMAADSLCRVYIRAHPTDPGGYLMLAGTLLAEMIDQEENLYPIPFSALLDTVDLLCTRVLDTASANTRAWMYLLKGHARSYRSLWESRFGSLSTAVKLSFDGRSEYDRALECDRTLYDIYAGLGSFHYWKSAKVGGLLRWLGIFNDERREGIAELYLAAESSLVSRESARISLIWVWLDAEKYDSAIAIAMTLIPLYPEGKSFLWPLAQAYYFKRDFANSAIYYAMLREKILPRPGNYFNLVEIDYYLTRCRIRIDDTVGAREAAERFTSYERDIPAKTLERQRKKIDYLRGMIRKE